MKQNSPSNIIPLQIRQQGTYYLDNIKIYSVANDTIVNRQEIAGGYRYGFNGMERDDAVKGRGNSYTTKFRQYDPRVGRWLSIDPLAKKYADISPYTFSYDSPSVFKDGNGEQGIVTVKHNKSGGGTITISANFIVVGQISKESVQKYGNQIKAKLKNGTFIDNDGHKWSIVFDVHFHKYTGSLPVNEIPLNKGDNILKLGSAVRDYTNGAPKFELKSHRMGAPKNEIHIIDAYGLTGNVAYLGLLNDVSNAVHEILHLLGLSDRYTDKKFQGRTVSIPNTGFPNDVMSTPAGNPNINQTHYDNYGRTFSNMANGKYWLHYSIDVNQKTGNLIGTKQSGLTKQEKKQKSKPAPYYE